MGLAIGTGLVVLLVLIYALLEPYWIQTTEYEVEVKELPEVFERFSILHLSDLHGRVGVFSWKRFLSLARQADMIAITGDLYSPSLPRQRMSKHLAQLKAPHGVFYVSGNHDYRHGKLAVEPWEPGDRRLDNRLAVIERGDARLIVAGLPDFVKGKPEWERLRAELQAQEGPVLLLAHRPDAWALPGVERVALILSGHTHGGQITIPGIWAPLRHNHVPGHYVAGRLDMPGKPVLITSRGLGTSEIPMRLGARPQLIRIRLRTKRLGGFQPPPTL